MRRQLDELEDLATRVLERAGTRSESARSVARALVAADADGLPSHGVARLPAYSSQVRAGKVSGNAVPVLEDLGVAAARVDAADGFAYPAFDLAIEAIAAKAESSPVVTVAIHHSHHFGVAGHHAERVAEAGLIGMVLGNSPAAIAPWGGDTALYGTNPIAFGFPRRNAEPLVIDMSLSRQARGKIVLAAKEGKSIPEGWALDSEGQPTTDPDRALEGSMVPLGESKGAALALAVEIMAAALTGANFGFEASSFFNDDGGPPRVGQALLAFDPAAFSGGSFADRLEVLLEAVLAQEGTRLPGSRRIAARATAKSDGVELPDELDSWLVEAARD